MREGFHKAPFVMPPSERIMAIANSIERYVAEHPRAADTSTGIRTCWVGRNNQNVSAAELQQALEHLIEHGGLSRTTLADGTVIYGRAFQ